MIHILHTMDSLQNVGTTDIDKCRWWWNRDSFWWCFWCFYLWCGVCLVVSFLLWGCWLVFCGYVLYSVFGVFFTSTYSIVGVSVCMCVQCCGGRWEGMSKMAQKLTKPTRPRKRRKASIYTTRKRKDVRSIWGRKRIRTSPRKGDRRSPGSAPMGVTRTTGHLF